MKKISLYAITLAALLMQVSIHMQAQTGPEGDKTVMGVRTMQWKSPAAGSVSALPLSVDNSVSRHFPPIFNQIGNSCAQASGTGYMFTYEMNALLDRDASLAENRFSYLFCWNFINGGRDEGGFSTNGLDLGRTTGIMTEADFPGQTTVSSYRWATGFEKYLNAMKYRPSAYVRLEITDEESLVPVKQYLYDKGVEGGKGGVLCFSGYSSGWTFDEYYDGPSETGYDCLLTSLPDDGAHGMTIVGYDDTVEYTSPDGQVHKGAFIAVNSWGTFSHDNGRYYLPYHFFLSPHDHLALGNDLLGVEVEYREHPDIVFRIALDYTSRDDLSLRLGVSGNASDTSPRFDYPAAIVYNQGGDYPMQGQYDGTDLEIAVDFSQYADKVAGMSEPNYFLTVTRNKFGNVLGEGTIRAFSVYDFRENPDNPAIYTCESIDNTPLAIGKNVFNIPTVEPDKCSYSPVQWINTLTGQPVAAPFVFRTADGRYAKVRFSDYDRENGTIRIRYVYAADGSHNLK